MTYNVFGETLNLAQSINITCYTCFVDKATHFWYMKARQRVSNVELWQILALMLSSTTAPPLVRSYTNWAPPGRTLARPSPGRESVWNGMWMWQRAGSPWRRTRSPGLRQLSRVEGGRARRRCRRWGLVSIIVWLITAMRQLGGWGSPSDMSDVTTATANSDTNYTWPVTRDPVTPVTYDPRDLWRGTYVISGR